MAVVITNISYCPSSAEDKQRQFDIYYPGPSKSTEESQSQSSPSLICFIHGGAWRSEDKRNHEQTARNLVKATGCPVAVPNYRLTPTNNTDPAFFHPMHVLDMLQFLSFIRGWKPAPNSNGAGANANATVNFALDPNSLILLGHSCSAHMLASVFLHNPDSRLAPSPELASAVKAIVFSEGIFDIDLLLARFPDYRGWFIEAAFGAAPSFDEYSVVKYPLLSRGSSSPISWLVLHSKGDTLVDQSQSDAMFAHLLDITGPENVSLDVDNLKEEHNDILVTETYANLVGDFVKKHVH
ncbi:alpha/beta-hydrolase [Agrocybe pediades]|nr:alpha/beta-hydrolase [Agrocybe pediades]